MFHVCFIHPCSVFLDVYSVLCLFYSTTCVCVCHVFYGSLRECLRARRFRATLLLHTTCVHSWCTWRTNCVAAYKNKSRGGWIGSEFAFIWLNVPVFAIKSMVHCGSAFEPGAAGLSYYCTPPVCVPDVIGALTVWQQNTHKKKLKKYQINISTKIWINI